MDKRIRIFDALFMLLILVMNYGCGGGGDGGNMAPSYSAKIVVAVDLRQANKAFKSFMINIDGVYYQPFSSTTKLSAFQTDQKEIIFGKEYLFEVNGELTDDGWLATGQNYCADCLNGAIINLDIGNRIFEVNVTDLKWRDNSAGGGNAAIYFTFDGTNITWRKCEDNGIPNQQANTKKAVVVQANLPASANFQIFQVNVAGLYWQDFKDTSRLTTIQTNSIYIEKDKRYMLEINAKTSDGKWLADISGINSVLLAGISVKLILDNLTYAVNFPDLTWHNNGVGGGNPAIYFTFDGEKIVWRKI